MSYRALAEISRSTRFRNATFTTISRAVLAAACLSAVPAQALTVQWTTGTGATGHWYELVTDQDKGWTAAQADAVGKGGNLVSIRSAEEQAFLIDNLFKQGDDPDAAFGSYWIGLTDANNEQGTSTAGWTWSSGEGYAFHFFATASGQPDNNSSNPFGDGSAGEDYVQLVWRPDGFYALQGAWNDVREAGHWFAEGSGLTHLNRMGYVIEYTSAPSPVPIPAALPLMVTALAGLGFAGWRQRRRQGA